MNIVSYNREQLGAFIESELFKNLDRIPISYHRALSHMHNPDSSEEDILLWVAYEGESLIGYVGVLPGACVINGTEEKIYWLSCFWVDESYRHRTLASSLFYPLVRRYKDQLVICNFVPSLEKTYQVLGIFHPTIFSTGYRFYLLFCLADITLSRIPKTRFLIPFLRGIDSLLNLVLSIRTLAFKKLDEKSRVIVNAPLDEQVQSFISTFPGEGNFMRRDVQNLGWIMAYPWVLQGEPDEESRRYFFSSRSRQFEYRTVRISMENNLMGFVLLKIRDKTLTLSYIHALDDAVNDIAAYLLDLAQKEKIKSITTFDARVADAIAKHRERFVFLKKINRPYILSKKITNASWAFQEGDGDAVFT